MRFYRAKIVLTASILVVGFLDAPAKADNANPPKILDLIQVTQGPYKPGDLVTYKIVFTGGNPGLKFGDISFWGMDRYSFQEPKGVNDIYGNGLISFSLPTIDPGTYGPMTASIQDKTDLRSGWMNASSPRVGPLSFIVSDYIFKPIKIGEVTPGNLLTHTLDFKMIPKNPQIGELFELPKYSSVNVPIIYTVEANSSSICKVIREYEYPLLPGGKLQILNNGLCKVAIQSDLGKRPSYSEPQIISLAPSEASFSRGTLTFPVGIVKISSSKKTITCIKGKLTKKVSGINPKCPTGYKLA